MADFELLAPGGHQELVDEVLDRLDTKADYDGYYAQLTAGAADSLTGRGDGVSASYLYRTTGGDADVADGTATVKSIHGRTVVWNQLADNGNFANGSYHWAARESTLTVADGVATATPNSAGTARGLQALSTMGTAVVGHKYLISTEFNTNEATNLNISFSGGNPVTVVVPSTGTWHKCGAIWTNGNDTRVLPYLLTTANVTTSAQLKYRNVQIFDLTAMFGAGNEPSTVAEFEALYPEPYYPYDAGSLLSVQMEGIETVGFNQWDEEWELGAIAVATGQNVTDSNAIRSKNYNSCFPNTDYYIKGTNPVYVFWYDAGKNYISNTYTVNNVRQSPANAAYFRVRVDGTNTYNHDICINLSWSGYRNGEYEPYWQSERTIPAATYFPNGMRSAGTVYDELTADEAIVRVGEWVLDSQYCTRIDSSTDYIEAVFTVSSIPYPLDGANTHFTTDFTEQTNTDRIVGVRVGNNTAWYWRIPTAKQAATGTTLEQVKAYIDAHTLTVHYAIATPTMQAIDPPLNLSYRVSDFGTERVMHTDPTAAPTQQVVYGLNVVDTVRRLPTEYISHDSFTQFRIALATFLDATIAESWDATDGRYEYTITQNGE